MGKWSYHRRCLLLYLVIAGIALSGICVYAVCAERELSQRDPSQSDILPEQLSESFALLYYMANGRSHAALLDPDAELPQVLTDDFFNQLDQRCAQLANEGETQFYYRILDGAGEEIAASQPVSAGNVVLHLRIVFDAQGQKLCTVETGVKIPFSHKNYAVTVQLFPEGDNIRIYEPISGLSSVAALELQEDSA